MVDAWWTCEYGSAEPCGARGGGGRYGCQDHDTSLEVDPLSRARPRSSVRVNERHLLLSDLIVLRSPALTLACLLKPSQAPSHRVTLRASVRSTNEDSVSPNGTVLFWAGDACDWALEEMDSVGSWNWRGREATHLQSQRSDADCFRVRVLLKPPRACVHTTSLRCEWHAMIGCGVSRYLDCSMTHLELIGGSERCACCVAGAIEGRVSA